MGGELDFRGDFEQEEVLVAGMRVAGMDSYLLKAWAARETAVTTKARTARSIAAIRTAVRFSASGAGWVMLKKLMKPVAMYLRTRISGASL